MTTNDYEQLAPFKNCVESNLISLYPVLAVGRVGSSRIIAIGLNLDDYKAILLVEVNGLFHKIREKRSNRPLNVGDLERLINHLNH